MPHLRTVALGFSLLPVLASCTSWTHGSKGSHHFSYDNAVCAQEALDKVKPSYHEHKYETGKKSQSYTMDVSESLRARVRMNCLQRNGWIAHVRMPWSDPPQSGRPPSEPFPAEPRRSKRRLAAAR
jgi:hypothetical protein